jgi:hypothetical protein
MALTKVRLPVADIAAISSGTSGVTILSAGGNIDVNVAGVDVLDLTSTTATVGVTLIADVITGEAISLATAGGAAASIATGLSSLTVQTTSAHTLVLGANSTTGMTVGTDGKVTLGVQGTAATHLVNKSYVDTAIALAPALTDMVFAATSPGSLTIPNSTGNDLIINWGITASLSNTFATVTFDTAYPNAVLCALATDVIGPTREASSHVNAVTLTNMQVVQSGSGASRPVYWLAIGY